MKNKLSAFAVTEDYDAEIYGAKNKEHLLKMLKKERNWNKPKIKKISKEELEDYHGINKIRLGLN